MPGKTTLSAPSETLQPESEEENEVDDILYLTREGGVEFLDYLLAKAVLLDPESPNTASICEWTFRDILKMPSASQKEWKQACHKELESLHSCKVFELVDHPKGHKIIINRWVFDLKTDLQKKAQLVAKGFSQVEGLNFNEIFSPMVQFEPIWMMIALAVLKN